MKPEWHPKNWGEGSGELWIENGPLYCGKLLKFRAGGRTSMHYHRLKTETMYLAKGRVLIRMEDEVIPMEVGDKLQILPFQWHQIEAVEDSELFEFSTEHFESDSIRK